MWNLGESDVPTGVQWSWWHPHRKKQSPVLAVNLEGIQDDVGGWPIGRLIAAELVRPLVPSVAHRYGVTDYVDVWVGYDIWSPVRGRVRHEDLLDTTAFALTDKDWTTALRAARAFQNADGTGRTKKVVRLKNGKTRPMDVSPHINFTTR